MQKSTVRSIFFFYQCSRSNIPDELCPQLSKTGCLQCYSGKCFQTPPFFYLFAVALWKNCSQLIHKRWFLINVPNWISMANIFCSVFQVQKLASHTQTDERTKKLPLNSRHKNKIYHFIHNNNKNRTQQKLVDMNKANVLFDIFHWENINKTIKHNGPGCRNSIGSHSRTR